MGKDELTEAHLIQVCYFLLDVFIGSSLNFHLLSHGRQGLMQSIGFPLSLLTYDLAMSTHNHELSDYPLNKLIYHIHE